MNGANGKVLWVDLTSGKTREERVPPETFKRWLGGYGLAIGLVYERIPRGCDPLGKENILALAPGLLTGSLAPITGRSFACAKSPKTGGWNDSSIGGHCGAAMRRSWYDAVLVSGASPAPVYLHLGDEAPELLDATDLWGTDVRQADATLKDRHGSKTRNYVIGKAGERLSTMAGICSDLRIAARGGTGAVMGSKKLKAVCMSGTRKVPVHDEGRVTALARAYNSKFSRNVSDLGAKIATGIAPLMGNVAHVLNIPMAQNHAIGSRVFKLWGTAFATNVQVAVGDTPVQNFKGVGHKLFPARVGHAFTTEAMERWIAGKQGCFSCPVQCGHVMNVPELGLEGTQRPEYETLAALGPLLLNKDVKTVFQANDMLNRAGMDTISAGVTAAFVMECCEQGILSKKDFECAEHPDGFLPAWNDSGSVLPLLRMIVDREGIGDLLANGVHEAARIIGKGAPALAMAINKQEVPMHDPRKTRGLATTYIADPTPARHTAASLDFHALGEVNSFVKGISFDTSKTGRLQGREHARFAKFLQALNALGLCEFALYFETYPLLELVEAVTGWNATIDDVIQAGHRIQVARQLFNAREDAIRFDVSPRVLGNPPLTEGPLKGARVDPRTAILEYFQEMGFSSEGVPLPATLDALGLGAWKADLDRARGRPVPAFT